jgi:hypothetical protein
VYGPFAAVMAIQILLVFALAGHGRLGAWGLRLPWWGRPDGEQSIPAGGAILAYLGSWLLTLLAVVVFPAERSRTVQRRLILLAALACRIAVWPLPASDDVNRYLWEGRLLGHGLSPYRHAALATSDPSADPYRDPTDPIWAGINHPTMTAIYPPLTLGVFALVARGAYAPSAVKLLMGLLDLGVVLVLLRLLEERALPLRWALLHALHPLVLLAFAGEGHLEPLQILPLLAALLLYGRGRPGMMFFLLGLAAQAKYIVLLVTPLFLQRDNLKRGWILAVTFLAPFLPFLITTGDSGLLRSLHSFGTSFAFNGALHGALRMLLGSLPAATAISGAVLLLGWLAGLWEHHPARAHGRDPDPLRGIFFILGLLLLVAPTVHYWYLAPLLPLLALRPTASWLLLSGTIGFSFTAAGLQLQGAGWQLPLWAWLATWLPPASLFARDGLLALKRRRTRRVLPMPRSISAVIPCLEEESTIAECVRALRSSPRITQIIVVDGGSKDRTVSLARKAGARVIVWEHPPEAGGGRGGQIRAGALAARGDVIAIVHADSRLHPDAPERIIQVLQRNPDFIGGALGAHFAAPGAKLRILEYANHFRAAFLGISFGDQVQFFRHDPAITAELTPAIPLMEDVELALRLHRRGRVTYLWGGSTASARRWELGALHRVATILGLVLGYVLQRLIRMPDTREMYYRYYPRRQDRDPSPGSAASPGTPERPEE